MRSHARLVTRTLARFSERSRARATRRARNRVVLAALASPRVDFARGGDGWSAISVGNLSRMTSETNRHSTTTTRASTTTTTKKKRKTTTMFRAYPSRRSIVFRAEARDRALVGTVSSRRRRRRRFDAGTTTTTSGRWREDSDGERRARGRRRRRLVERSVDDGEKIAMARGVRAPPPRAPSRDASCAGPRAEYARARARRSVRDSSRGR